ncbi:MAG: dockerin type I domain-containing protein [Planctomycetota bacterium]
MKITGALIILFGLFNLTSTELAAQQEVPPVIFSFNGLIREGVGFPPNQNVQEIPYQAIGSELAWDPTIELISTNPFANVTLAGQLTLDVSSQQNGAAVCQLEIFKYGFMTTDFDNSFFGTVGVLLGATTFFDVYVKGAPGTPYRRINQHLYAQDPKANSDFGLVCTQTGNNSFIGTTNSNVIEYMGECYSFAGFGGDQLAFWLNFSGFAPDVNPRWGATCVTTCTIQNLAIAVEIGDVNVDGLVNLLDVEPFIQRLSNGSFQAEADCNEDGVVNLLDVEPFVAILGGG